jgi:hypothetical protein
MGVLKVLSNIGINVKNIDIIFYKSGRKEGLLIYKSLYYPGHINICITNCDIIDYEDIIEDKDLSKTILYIYNNIIKYQSTKRELSHWIKSNIDSNFELFPILKIRKD